MMLTKKEAIVPRATPHGDHESLALAALTRRQDLVTPRDERAPMNYVGRTYVFAIEILWSFLSNGNSQELGPQLTCIHPLQHIHLVHMSNGFNQRMLSLCTGVHLCF